MINNDNGASTTTLDRLKEGMQAVVTAVTGHDKALRMHILRMGLTPGVVVKLVKTAPMGGDPLEIKLRGYELTLRKAIAADIIVKILKTAPNADPSITRTSCGHTDGYNHHRTLLALDRTTLNSSLNLALVGNQNSGKTTLFNRLTNAHQRVGNFPGVTVEKVDGLMDSYRNITIVDLPGIYSLSPYSKEEMITRNFLLHSHPDGIINIVDATNLERNLFLTLQLIELNVPMVIALNMMDTIAKNHTGIDIDGLESALGVPIIPISAAQNAGIEDLVECAANLAIQQKKPDKIDFCDPGDNNHELGAVHRAIHSISHIIEEHARATQIATRFAATKIIEDDPLITRSLNLDANDITSCNQIIRQMEEDTGMDRQAAICDMRFNFIEKLVAQYVFKPTENAASYAAKLADKILTGKYTALPAFAAIMGLVFYLAFGPLGETLTRLLIRLLSSATNFINNSMASYGFNPVWRSLIVDGACLGISSVLVFLPVLTILFLCLSILEGTGYMTRIAFVMDNLLRKIGLSGKSFVPMLIGFGCSVPAIMATRALSSERDRKITVLLIPFMSCSAKLPIYALLASAFFPRHRAAVIVSIYLIGIIVSALFACLAKLLVFKSKPSLFVMEMPSYRTPSWYNIWHFVYYKAKDFVLKAFTLIFWASMIIWFLQNFDPHFNLVSDPARSLLARLATWLLPVFRPLGMSDWRIVTAFLTGFLAKESVISTLTVLLGNVANLPLIFTKLTAFVFMVFSLLYTPCIATIAAIKKELGRTYALLVVMLQSSVAWLVAYTVYRIGVSLSKYLSN